MTGGAEKRRGWLSGLVARLRGEPSTLEPSHASGGAAAAAAAVYAIGDIHGRLDLLLRLESMIAQDIARARPSSSRLVCLGDYIDRGPESRQVLEHLATRARLCSEEVFLRGNHEQVLLDFLAAPDTLDAWSQFGGLETLYSYGLRPRPPLDEAARRELQAQFSAALPPHHVAFLQRTRLSYETATHFFVHAGINPQVPLAQQKASDLLWIRDAFLNVTRRFEKLIVHGHTPVAEPEILANRVNVDTGAYATGRLTCAVLEGSSCRILTTGR